MQSTVDWCESNYEVSNYIAEFWNTLTGIFLIFSGVLFYINNEYWIHNESKKVVHFFRICGLLIVVGIGTILFHSTLYYPFQLMDELPMLLLSNQYLMLLMSLQTTRDCISQKYLDNLRKYLSYSNLNILLIVSVYFIHPVLQIISFHITLKISEISIFLILYKLASSVNLIAYSKMSDNSEILRNEFQLEFSKSILLYLNDYMQIKKDLNNAISAGLYFYGTSIGIWCVENMFCEYTNPYQLHAIWHVLSSVGIYYLNTIMMNHVKINNLTFRKVD
jgi:hypothetical protein